MAQQEEPVNVEVLYADYNGHLAPLSYCFHATASRQLSSCLVDYPSYNSSPEDSSSAESAYASPPSTKAQVDSAYCPQCLAFFDAATAASRGYCDTCKQCPRCRAAATVAVVVEDEHEKPKPTSTTEALCFYMCGYCSWTSQQCDVTTTIALSSTTTDQEAAPVIVDKEEMMQASRNLCQVLKSKTKTEESLVESRFRKVLAAWQEHSKKQQQQQQQHRTTMKTQLSVHRDGDRAWSLEALHESILQTKQQHEQPIFIVDEEADEAPTVTPSTAALEWKDSTTTTRALPSMESHLLQPLVCSSSTNTIMSSLSSMDDQDDYQSILMSSASLLLPLPMPLRARTSLKCRAELAKSRPGILLKPKLNPVEGDSSLRSGHGQWWKKDCSAHHVLPNISIAATTRKSGDAVVDNKHEHKTHVTTNKQRIEYRCCLLKVVNPTMGLVRMKLGLSSSSSTDTSYRKNVLMNVLDASRADIVIRPVVSAAGAAAAAGGDGDEESPSTTKQATASSSSPLVELEAVQDYIFESERSKLPDAISDWKPSNIASISHSDAAVEGNDKPSSASSFVRLVAVQKDTAWFELNVAMQDDVDDKGNMRVATPLAMEIQVGDGSWESSLVKKRDDIPHGAPDFVSFDVLIVWPATPSSTCPSTSS